MLGTELEIDDEELDELRKEYSDDPHEIDQNVWCVVGERGNPHLQEAT